MAKTDQICNRLAELTRSERRIHTQFLRTLNELEVNKVYAERGYPSTFAYMTKKLKLSESCAAKRLRAARAARRYPLVYALIEDGRLHMSHVALLSRHLTEANHKQLLSSAVHKTKAEVEVMVAALNPEASSSRETIKFVSRPQVKPKAQLPVPSVAAMMIKAATTTVPQQASELFKDPADSAEAPVPSAELSFTAKVHLSFDITPEVFNDLKRVKELLAHKHPKGKLEDVMAELIAHYINSKDPLRKQVKPRSKQTKNVKRQTRYIPAALRREVYRRDQGQCTFVAADGQRCGSRHFIEVDHIKPYCLAGASDDVENLRLVCRAHNQWHARGL